MKYTFIFCLLFLAFLSFPIKGQQTPKFVAVTIDDLPTVTDFDGDRPEREITRKIVGHIKRARIPAIGFVNETQLFPDGKRDQSEINLLRAWLDAGIDLGNHTYSHADINQIGLEAYEKDVVKGEEVTKELLKKYGKKLLYFRHPYLKTGQDAATKNGLESFLEARGYTIAPVTIAVSDWVFAHAYDQALLKKDAKLAKQISDAYVPFVLNEFAYAEKESSAMFQRQIKQTLLLHANNINAQNLGVMIAELRKRGYQFVSLGDALRDQAYRTQDEYIGADGADWFRRWTVTLGAKPLDGAPQIPEFVRKAAGAEKY